jgi:hypothetical protein
MPGPTCIHNIGAYGQSIPLRVKLVSSLGQIANLLLYEVDQLL